MEAQERRRDYCHTCGGLHTDQEPCPDRQDAAYRAGFHAGYRAGLAQALAPKGGGLNKYNTA